MSDQLDLLETLPARREPDGDTDCAFLLAVLRDGQPHTLNEILGRSFTERGCGLTVHSRASDLRNRFGYDVRWEHVPGAKRGYSSQYRLVA